MAKRYYIYIATNHECYILYTGVTNNINRRIYEHKQGIGSKFTKKYNINKLVYFEEYQDINQAIAREKQIKAGSRIKKVELINSLNPTWRDLIGATIGLLRSTPLRSQ
ncbi:MAG: GIY-YIG nuclease family protein [Candidatus Komeilibacteria bacterium]|nr:GIY-YIG nuclease family protein [Candidatus Komeilibacteria bacterium]